MGCFYFPSVGHALAAVLGFTDAVPLARLVVDSLVARHHNVVARDVDQIGLLAVTGLEPSCQRGIVSGIRTDFALVVKRHLDVVGPHYNFHQAVAHARDLAAICKLQAGVIGGVIVLTQKHSNGVWATPCTEALAGAERGVGLGSSWKHWILLIG